MVSIIVVFLFSGETAFSYMSEQFGWAKYPMIKRIVELEKDLPMTYLFGSRSWVDSSVAYEIKYLRSSSYVDIQVSSDRINTLICVSINSQLVPKTMFYKRWNCLVNQLCKLLSTRPSVKAYNIFIRVLRNFILP